MASKFARSQTPSLSRNLLDHSLQHQHNVLRSLGASGRVWELSNQNPRVVISQSRLDRRSGPSGAARRTWERRRQGWEHRQQAWKLLGAPATILGAPATSLGAPRITLAQSGRNNILFGNTAGAPGNHSYLC